MKQESKQDIVKRLQESLNAQQRSVPQLPAKAHARSISVLNAKTDPKHPFAGYMVGADESVEEAEGDPEGVPHLTRELLSHIVQQIGTEGAHAICKSLEWGDGAAKELLQLIKKDLQNHVSMAESVKQRLDPKCWKGKHKAGTKIKGGVRVNNCVPNESIEETAAWKRKEGKSKSGGLNAKGVASYRRENPGSKLQTAVTTKPSKLKAGSKAAKRRKSFCARMSGVKGPMKKPNGDPTRKALALRKWNCNESIDEATEKLGLTNKTCNRCGGKLVRTATHLVCPDCKTKWAAGDVNKDVREEQESPEDRQVRIAKYNAEKEAERKAYLENKLKEIDVRIKKIKDGGMTARTIYNMPRIMEIDRLENDRKKVVELLKYSFKPGVAEMATPAAIKAKNKAASQQSQVKESVANEDVLSALKNKLGDLLLQTLGREANDSDLKDKPTAQDDKEVNPIIKKITTDDGREICIHGNEDDGFHISVQGKEGSTKFESLDHAEMATKMYCGHRRNKKLNADYMDES